MYISINYSNLNYPTLSQLPKRKKIIIKLCPCFPARAQLLSSPHLNAVLAHQPLFPVEGPSAQGSPGPPYPCGPLHQLTPSDANSGTRGEMSLSQVKGEVRLTQVPERVLLRRTRFTSQCCSVPETSSQGRGNHSTAAGKEVTTILVEPTFVLGTSGREADGEESAGP